MTAQGPELRALADTLRGAGQAESPNYLHTVLRNNLPMIISALERAAAAKPCICNTGPDTEGPSEECPVHGRPYSYWVQGVTTLIERAADTEGEKAKGRYPTPRADSLSSSVQPMSDPYRSAS